MTSGTDELRRMLDERGVEYEGGERSLRWRDRYGVMIQAFPLANGELGMGVWSCTPEQAIAATLGATDARPTQEELSGTYAPTVEDVLRDFADEVYADADNEIRDRDFLCAKYAKRLTLAGGEDA